MIQRIAEHIGSLRLAGRERGGVAIIMLLGFIGLAVPLAVASVETAGQLSRNSRVYDSRLTGMYSAGAGVEVAMHEILSDPTFDDDLTQQGPSKEIDLDINGNTVIVTVTKIYSDEQLQGQGIVTTKEVSPSTASVNATTTFTYILTAGNEGSATSSVIQIHEFLPPGFTYVPNSTTGITTNNPTIVTNQVDATCGDVPDELRWNALSFPISSGEEATLMFEATATLTDGTYYNQAYIRFDPWWESPDAIVYTPYMAEITVGSGTPKCGYDMNMLVTETVDPAVPPVGVDTEFTYTITVENVSSSDTFYVCEVSDLLPPTFTYVTGSAGEYASNIATSSPALIQDPDTERWDATWEDNNYPLTSIPAGATSTQVFRASTTPVSGADYFNEINVEWARSLTGGGKCQSGGGTAFAGAGGASYVDPPTLYDIQAVAPDGTIESRIVFYSVEGEIEVVSWQEY